MTMFEYAGYAFYVSDGISFLNLRFENDVEMYGTQTSDEASEVIYQFENDVANPLGENDNRLKYFYKFRGTGRLLCQKWKKQHPVCYIIILMTKS